LLRDHARAAMDLSDGLAKDLARMTQASGSGAVVRVADLPLSAGLRRALVSDRSLIRHVIAGGDDYEVLAAVPPGRADAYVAEAAAAGVPVARIGEMTADAGDVGFIGADGQRLVLGTTGWDHF
jgi:thiamine-monophosphate kinase